MVVRKRPPKLRYKPDPYDQSYFMLNGHLKGSTLALKVWMVPWGIVGHGLKSVNSWVAVTLGPYTLC